MLCLHFQGLLPLSASVTEECWQLQNPKALGKQTIDKVFAVILQVLNVGFSINKVKE